MPTFIRPFASGLLLVLCLIAGAPAARADTALYDAFGGEAGLVRISDDFIANLTSDPRTQPYFAKSSLKRLREKFPEHFCEQLGGPCKYTGSSMLSVHKNLHIDRIAFNAVVENLQKAMDKNDVPFTAQNALLARLAPMHREIETR